MSFSDYLTTTEKLLSIGAVLLSIITFCLLAYLRGKFVPVADFNDLKKANGELAEKLNANDNEEARKRRDLQERVAKLEVRVEHLPTSDQVQTILIELGKASASLSRVDNRINEMQETLRREVDSVKDLVGAVQETMRMIQGARQ